MGDLGRRDPPLNCSWYLRSTRVSRVVALGLAISVLMLAPSLGGQGAPSPSPLTLLSKDGRRAIAVSLVGDQEFVALDDLAAMFQLAVRGDSLGPITVSYKGRPIVPPPDQALASPARQL